MEKNIRYNKKCIEIAEQISDIRIKGYGLSNTIEALVHSNQLDTALEYANNALDIFNKLEERDMIALNYMNFGLIFKQKEDWNKAIENFKKAIELMEDLDVPYHLSKCYHHYSEVYSNKGEDIKAKYYLHKADEIKDSITTDNRNGHIIGKIQ